MSVIELIKQATGVRDMALRKRIELRMRSAVKVPIEDLSEVDFTLQAIAAQRAMGVNLFEATTWR